MESMTIDVTAVGKRQDKWQRKVRNGLIAVIFLFCRGILYFYKL